MFTTPVLLVDVDDELAGLLARVLAPLGLATVVATEGESALRLARDQPPRAAIVGPALLPALRALRALPGGAALPGVILLAEGDEAPLLHPADHLLRRPFRFETLVQMLVPTRLAAPTSE
jgi:DNA-binding response OmpR family regulator